MWKSFTGRHTSHFPSKLSSFLPSPLVMQMLIIHSAGLTTSQICTISRLLHFSLVPQSKQQQVVDPYWDQPDFHTKKGFFSWTRYQHLVSAQYLLPDSQIHHQNLPPCSPGAFSTPSGLFLGDCKHLVLSPSLHKGSNPCLTSL